MRMHLKRYRSKKRKIKIIIFFIMILFLIILVILNKIGSNLSSYYLEYSKREAIEIIDSSLNNGVNKEVFEEFKQMNLYDVSKNKDGEIETIDYNSYYVNSILKKVNTNIYNSVKKEERSNKDASFYVPLFAISKNPLLATKGPKIPVRMEAIGSVISSVKTKVTSSGINSSLIELSIHVEITEKVILPVISGEIKVTNDIPISYKIISGKVPSYYGDSLYKNSGILSLPVE